MGVRKELYVITAPSGYWEDVISSREAAESALDIQYTQKGLEGYHVEKWVATKAESEPKTPDWEAFAREVFEYTGWPECFHDIEAVDVFDMAKKHGVIQRQPGGFDPETDFDATGMLEGGEEWWIYHVEPKS